MLTLRQRKGLENTSDAPVPCHLYKRAMAPVRPFKVFISYTHEDEDFRKRLEQTLKVLKRQGLLDYWRDRSLLPGVDVDSAITTALGESDIVLLLVSPAWQASDWCQREAGLSLERATSGSCHVVPIILRPSDHTGEAYFRLLALPTDARPISTASNQDVAWLDVSTGLRGIIDAMRQKLVRPTPSPVEQAPGVPNQEVPPVAPRLMEFAEVDVLSLFMKNLGQFNRRSMQAEAKSNLKGLYTASKSYYQEKDCYPATFEVAGFRPELGARYFYIAGDNVTGGTSAHGPRITLKRARTELERLGIVTHMSAQSFLVVAVTQLENGKPFDVWLISSDDGTPVNVQAGV